MFNAISRLFASRRPQYLSCSGNPITPPNRETECRASEAYLKRIAAVLDPHDSFVVGVDRRDGREALFSVITQVAGGDYFDGSEERHWAWTPVSKMYQHFVYLPPQSSRRDMAMWMHDQIPGARYQVFSIKGPLARGYTGIGYGSHGVKPGTLYVFADQEKATLFKLFFA